MNEVVVYVEGKGDLIFIAHLLDFHFKIKLDIHKSQLSGIIKRNDLKLTVQVFDIDSGNGGIDSKKIRNLVEEIRIANIPLGIKSVLIIDTDTPNHSNPKGGYSNRASYLADLCAGTGISYFLIPNNHDDGNLESLLNEIVSAKGLPYYICLQGFVSCLSSLSSMEVPPRLAEKHWEKIKMEWYTYNMDVSVSPKSGRNYKDDELWNLNASSLSPLREFLAATIGLESV